MGFAIDAILPSGVRVAAEAAAEYEKMGFAGVFSPETQSDPFVDLAGVALATSDVVLGTNLAIAFARSPFVTAMASWHLHKASSGRFVLGLGTQVKGHIERRFGMKWESPGPKLREYVRAVKAIWAAFEGESPLNFKGDFYEHTVISPFFDAGPLGMAPPKIWIAAVNTYNARTVGEVADGILVHPVHSRKYLDDVLLPSIHTGLEKSGRQRGDIDVVCPVFLVLDGPQGSPEAASFVRMQIAFYGSTRTYAPIFEAHGWDDIPGRLHELMRAGDIAAMSDLVTDDMLEVFAITCPADDAVDAIRARYAGVADRLYMYNLFASPFANNDGRLREFISALSS